MLAVGGCCCSHRFCQQSLDGDAVRFDVTGRSSSDATHVSVIPDQAIDGGPSQELYTYDEYDAFADDEGISERLRADVADALGEKYVEELDI